MTNNEDNFLENFVGIIEKETFEQKRHIYDKLYRFLGIDLTVFPIINGISIFLSFDFFIIPLLLAYLSFLIAIFSKFFIITFKLKSFITPPNALNGLRKEEMEEEFLHHRHQKVVATFNYLFDEKGLIKTINHSIAFTLVSIVASLSNFLQNNLIRLEFNIEMVFWAINIFNIIVFILAFFYRYLDNHKEEISGFLKKLYFWNKSNS
jgi:hypothetical protein